MSFFNPIDHQAIINQLMDERSKLGGQVYELESQLAFAKACARTAEEMRDFYKEHYEELKKERAVPADQNNWAKVQEKVTQLEAVEDADTTVLEAQEGFLDRFNEIHGGGLSVEDMLERRAAFDAEHKQEAE